MRSNSSQNGEPLFLPEDMVSASELREFVFCERAWFVSRRGYRVSAEASAQRSAGIAFHEARAGAASRGRSSWLFWIAVLLAGAGLSILLLQFWQGVR